MQDTVLIYYIPLDLAQSNSSSSFGQSTSPLQTLDLEKIDFWILNNF